MAIDPEEYKMRRQQRQQKRNAARLRNRRILLRLGIAAMVLLLCGVLIFLAGRGAFSPTPPLQTDPPQTTNASETAESVPAESGSPASDPTEPATKIHFVAVGDLNITDAVVDSGGSDADYTQAFLDVAPLLASGDITTINLEGNFYGSPYGSETRSAPAKLAQALDKAGVDLVQLANSYSIVHGMLGLSDTIDCVRANGMEPLGVYATNAEFAQKKGYTIRTVQGIRIAFIAFTKGMIDGMALPGGSEDCVNLLYKDYASTYQSVDTAGITEILDATAAEMPDITVALLHWGSEYNDTISDTQQRICNLLKQKGVNVIIGTHPHYVQKMELDAETGTFLAYSLGDFFGDAQRAGSEYSVILDLEITKDNANGVTKVTDYSYTPIFTVAEADSPLRVVRIHEAMAAYESNHINSVSSQTYEKMKYALERIEARISGE